MKKVLMALIASGLLAGVANAGIVKQHQFTGSATTYIGTKTALPSSGYLYVGDDNTAAYVYTFVSAGKKYYSGPWVADITPWNGTFGKITVGMSATRIDVNALLVPIRVNHCQWYLQGVATGVGGIPSSLKGIIDLNPADASLLGPGGVFEIATGEYSGGGYGVSSSASTKTVNDAVSTAATLAADLVAQLSGKGYLSGNAIVTP